MAMTFALLAQLDRVFGYEPKGQGFESLTARQKIGIPEWVFLFSFLSRCKGRETSSKKRERNERRLGERSGGPFVKREESPEGKAFTVCAL